MQIKCPTNVTAFILHTQVLWQSLLRPEWNFRSLTCRPQSQASAVLRMMAPRLQSTAHPDLLLVILGKISATHYSR